MKPESIIRIIRRHEQLWNSNNYLLRLVLVRFIIRHVLAQIVSVQSDIQYYERQKRLFKKHNIIAPFLEAALKKKEELLDLFKELLSCYGEDTKALLDLWQMSGATLRDLASLCGKPWSVVEKEVSPEDRKRDFSDLMFVYGLDYQDNGSGWYEYEQDGPFTHAVKEYMLDQMLHTKAGQEASDKAFQKCFPDLWDKRMYAATDYEGNPVLIDKDGEIVGYIPQKGEEENDSKL